MACFRNGGLSMGRTLQHAMSVKGLHYLPLIDLF